MRYLLVFLLALAGCEATSFTLTANQASPPDDPVQYASVYPWYIETCAVSGMLKKPGFGFEHRSGSGGHAVMYLNGVCTVEDASYPTLRLCDEAGAAPVGGVGISANAHFSNAAWVATPTRAFLFDGALRPGETLDAASYRRTQDKARQLGIMNGVRFHEEVFDDMPPDMSREDYKYEVSISTDYAVAFGRGRYCARLPVGRAQMQRAVDFLNARNAMFKDGPRESNMAVLENNCSHLTHNVLAAVGLWDEWPTDRSILRSALSFPVPKNEFVNQMVRSNDMPIDDPALLYRDGVARRTLGRDDWLPTGPGAIANAHPPRGRNALYDTDVRLIFYDILPVVGQFDARLDRIAAEPRYTDLEENLRHFARIYQQAAAAQAGAANNDPDFVLFKEYYDRHIAHMSARAQLALRMLQHRSTPVELAEYGRAR